MTGDKNADVLMPLLRDRKGLLGNKLCESVGNRIV